MNKVEIVCIIAGILWAFGVSVVAVHLVAKGITWLFGRSITIIKGKPTDNLSPDFEKAWWDRDDAPPGVSVDQWRNEVE